MATPADKVFQGRTPAAAPHAAPGESARPVTAEASAEPSSDFPCSVAQERFWLLDRLDPGSSSYNVAVRWRLEGRVLIDVLQASWLKIIERHEILRTVFLEIDGAPVQRAMPHIPFRLNEIDLGALSPDLQKTEGDRIGIIEARAPFDLSTGPMIRVTLLRLSPMESIILVTTHQIVSDGWSIGVMAREMGVIYDAMRRDSDPPLEPLAIQYADYSQWQLEWLRVRGTETETVYWTRQLAGVQPFKVIADHPRPAMPTTNGAIVSRVLPRDLTNRAQALSADRGATLFAAALGALCATLARFTNQTEIVLGTQVSDRDQVELESMVGQFVNSLILRNQLDGNPRFNEIVDRVRDTVAQALEHRHIPIERLLGMVKGERSHANSAPISVNFIFQKTFIQNTAYSEFKLIDMPSLPAGAIYDLNFFMVERTDGWRFSCQYNTDQFDGATAERLLDYFRNVLESAVADAGRRLSELNLGEPAEAAGLLGKLNATRTLYPRDLTLAKIFEAQALRAPDALAVICEQRQLTYGEVNASANRIAGHLRERGIAPGARVGICMSAAVELPICVLAVLKTGAAYVLLDPAEPPARRAELIAAARATAIIGRNLQPSEAIAGISMIDAATALALAHEMQPSNIAISPALESDSVACLTFSLGSAEASHIVGLSHRNLANLIYSMAKQPGVGDRDVIVATSPIGSDRATFEILLPLLTGARLVMALEKDLGHGRTLLGLLHRTAATVMYGESQLWQRLLEAGWIGVPTLKMLCSAADMNGRLGEQLLATGGELWALYGHPEAGVWSSIQRLMPKQRLNLLGQPIANTSLQVLDAALQAAPVGATGEVYIGGDGLAANLPADSRISLSGTTLFRTGDLGRLRSNGQIENLGRSDDRITYLGRPIDPAQIERILLRLPDVAQATVVGAEDGTTGGSITAYVAPRSPPPNESEWVLALRQSVSALLPPYLAPTAYEIRDSLPQTADGQPDRGAVRATRSSKGSSRPSGKIEEQLAEIWKAMLSIPAVNAGDNFFELGGHSLLAARMLTQVEKVFGRRIKLAALFLAPTLQELAQLLSQENPREFDFRQVVKIQPNGSKRPLIAINNTGIYYGLAKSLGAEQPVYSLQLFDPSVAHSALPNTLEEIAAGYVDLIRRVQPQGPYDLMGWCVAGALAFEIGRQLIEAKQQVAHLFLMDSWAPGYLTRLSRPRALVADYSLRLKLIIADWRRVMSGEKSLGTFLSERKIVNKVRRLFSRSKVTTGAEASNDFANPETYDAWLLEYLRRVTASYSPQQYTAKVTLLRSRLEPAGWFFPADAGWAAVAPAGVEVLFVDGNHYTMFQGVGAKQMAAHVANVLGYA
ncbi:MAG TPA: condensation domain-containing protein [Steroidobacteraceae bacterium]|nr:condensation domain-containing protein [Steroidobacteraceae bacterium]